MTPQRGIRLALAVALATPTPAAALAQGNRQASDLAQTRRSDTGRGDEFGRPTAQVAQVGADTTNGSTTGYGGPKGDAGLATGQADSPPLPSPELCKPYKDTLPYRSCLQVVLRQEVEE